MLKTTVANDTVDSFLSRHVGNYNDQLERDFYAINSGVEEYGVFLPAGIELSIPAKKAPPPKIRRTPWE